MSQLPLDGDLLLENFIMQHDKNGFMCILNSKQIKHTKALYVKTKKKTKKTPPC